MTHIDTILRRLMSIPSCAGLLLASLLWAGCTPVQLAVRRAAPQQALRHEQPCEPGADALACLAGARPEHRLRLAPGEKVDWVQASDDGGAIAVAVKSKRADGQGDVSQLVLIDAAAGREAWRVQLDEAGVLGISRAYFPDAGQVVLATTSHPSVPATLLSLDRRDGNVRWRYPAITEQGGSHPPVSVIVQDPERGFLVVEVGAKLEIVDGTGRTISSMARLDDPERGFGASGYVSGDDIFLVDNGLVRIDRQAKRFVWSSKFVTYTHDPHTASNAGRVVGSILLSVLTAGVGGQTVNLASVPPDFLVGLVTEPITSGSTVCMGALSGINCFDRRQGRLLWSRRFGVLQFQTLVASSDRLYALSGGRHVHVRGVEPLEVNEVKQSGLYSLRLTDGDRSDGFASPFGPNTRGALVSAQALSAEDPKQAADAAEKMSAALAGINFPLFGLRLTKAGLLVLGLHKAALLDARSGAFVREVDLRAVGPVIGAVSGGPGRLLVRGEKGLATFDEESGALLWTAPLAPAASLQKLGDPAAQRLLQLPSAIASTIETNHFKEKLFWPLPDRNLVLVPTAGASGTELSAVRLTDGAVAARIAVPGRVSILPGRKAQFAVVDAGTYVDLFRLPVLAPPEPPPAPPPAAVVEGA
jgi:hypothetical protein